MNKYLGLLVIAAVCIIAESRSTLPWVRLRRDSPVIDNVTDKEVIPTKDLFDTTNLTCDITVDYLFTLLLKVVEQTLKCKQEKLFGDQSSTTQNSLSPSADSKVDTTKSVTDTMTTESNEETVTPCEQKLLGMIEAYNTILDKYISCAKELDTTTSTEKQ